MLARHATRAGFSRASFVGGVSPPSAKVVEITNQNPSDHQIAAQNDGLTPPGRPAWKYAYEDLLWSKQTLPLNLRAVLQVLLRLSDHLGRVWWSQRAIAEQAGCTVRTLRRLLPALEASGYARVEPMTFRQLSVTQAALGLPLPGRCDDGRAPDLITLLVAGKPATDLRPLSRRRAPSPGQTFLAPRTISSFVTPENPVDPGDISSDDPRDLSGDLDQIGGIHPAPCLKVRNVSGPNTEARGDEHAWEVLRATYDAHYKRVYHARPTDKPLAHESRMLMAGHLADMATLLRAKFVERNVELSSLEKSPVELLADEALRVWFASSGTNDYLRRVSHRMSALSADLPYRVRKALDTLVERLAPKPEPRLAMPSIATSAQSVGRSI
ncbi:MAG TPA: helix-turn-helix domain-containing protein, partial [Polyangium sp.]|nr:helix-turn-helix domain-containing protein [Polyangium sp.]